MQARRSTSSIPPFSSSASGLKITEGQGTRLFAETHGGVDCIIDRVLGGDHDGEAAFALHIDANGVVSMVQWLSVANSDAGILTGYDAAEGDVVDLPNYLAKMSRRTISVTSSAPSKAGTARWIKCRSARRVP